MLAACAAVSSPQPMQIVQRGGTHNSGEGSVCLFLGQSTLHSDEAFPVENENLFGISIRALSPQSSPIGIEMGYNYRKGTNNGETIPGSGTFDFRSRTDEVYLGLWAPITTESFYHPYFGTGFDMYSMRAKREGFNVSDGDKDVGYGAYGHVGVLFNLTDHVQWGVDLRGVLGNRVNLFGERTYGNYTQAALTLVFGF
jgi:hypothetical protein